MTQAPHHVLFICRGNAISSIMAEAVLNRRGGTRFRGFSAGTEPRGEVDQLALQLLKALDLPTEGLRSKSWREFATPQAPRLDYVISLCDETPAGLTEVLAGQPVYAHWGITEPTRASDDPVQRKNAVRRALRELENRIGLFVLLRHGAVEQRNQAAPRAEAV